MGVGTKKFAGFKFKITVTPTTISSSNLREKLLANSSLESKIVFAHLEKLLLIPSFNIRSVF